MLRLGMNVDPAMVGEGKGGMGVFGKAEGRMRENEKLRGDRTSYSQGSSQPLRLRPCG